MGDTQIVAIPGWPGHRATPTTAAWWVAYVAVGVSRGLTRPRLVQALGNSKKSAGVHLDGTAIDLDGVPADELVAWAQLAREFGAAAWPRGARWGQPSMDDHVHLILDCPETVEGRYQIVEARRGGDGLTGSRPDYLTPAMAPLDAAQGLAAMTALLTPTTPTTPAQEEDDEMARLVKTQDSPDVYYVSVATGAYWHVPAGDWLDSGVLYSSFGGGGGATPGIAEISDRELALLRDSAARTAAVIRGVAL